MVYIESPSTNPAFNLALEQYVFDRMDRSQEYFMLWQNDNTVVIGKNQNAFAEVNQKVADAKHISVVRRLSGGGAVYHDLGNLNFTFILDAKDATDLDIRLFCQPIAELLRSLNVPAEVNGRNDISIEGKKFSGNSQYLKQGRIMHHGTLMFHSDLSVVADVLNVSADKFQSKAAKSVKARVTNIAPYLPEGFTLAQFKALLLKYILKEENVLYGQAAQEPEVPAKQQDEVYHYIFNGWDNTFDHIKENTEVHAVFSSVYNEYKVSIYEQLKERLVEEKIYHYGDIIDYPVLRKKGYTLQWNIHPETVTQNEKIYASWDFSNPVGKVFEVDGNSYQILNPSITNGSVRLLSYTQDASQIQIPERVQIGDYYYFIEEIAIRAFCNCVKMRTLILPNCVRIISDGAFMNCKRLEKIVLGKDDDIKLHSIGKKAFAENEHLREIYFAGRNLRKVYPATFEGIRKTIKVLVLPAEKAKIEKLLQKALREGKVLIDLI